MYSKNYLHIIDKNINYHGGSSVSNTHKIKLALAQTLRITTVFIILFFTKIPLHLKIIAIIAFDTFDCGLPRLLFGQNNWISCKSQLYQTTDKFTDSICYTLLLLSLFSEHRPFIESYGIVIIPLFIHRMVATISYIFTDYQIILFIFPNF